MNKLLVTLAVSLFVTTAAADNELYSQDGTYLGKLGGSQYDSESTNNPYGRYGSQYSPDSINNPYGRYGSQYSNESPNNPYATQQPVIINK